MDGPSKDGPSITVEGDLESANEGNVQVLTRGTAEPSRPEAVRLVEQQNGSSGTASSNMRAMFRSVMGKYGDSGHRRALRTAGGRGGSPKSAQRIGGTCYDLYCPVQ